MENTIFSLLWYDPVTLTLGQGQSITNAFEALMVLNHQAKFGAIMSNSLREIANVKVFHRRTDGRTFWTI